MLAEETRDSLRAAQTKLERNRDEFCVEIAKDIAKFTESRERQEGQGGPVEVLDPDQDLKRLLGDGAVPARATEPYSRTIQEAEAVIVRTIRAEEPRALDEDCRARGADLADVNQDDVMVEPPGSDIAAALTEVVEETEADLREAEAEPSPGYLAVARPEDLAVAREILREGIRAEVAPLKEALARSSEEVRTLRMAIEAHLAMSVVRAQEEVGIPSMAVDEGDEIPRDLISEDDQVRKEIGRRERGVGVSPVPVGKIGTKAVGKGTLRWLLAASVLVVLGGIVAYQTRGGQPNETVVLQRGDRLREALEAVDAYVALEQKELTVYLAGEAEAQKLEAARGSSVGGDAKEMDELLAKAKVDAARARVCLEWLDRQKLAGRM